MSATKLTRPDVRALDEIRTRYGAPWTSKKLDLLKRFSAASLRGLRLLHEYHEILLFLLAYPDSKRIRDLAEAELNRVADTLEKLADHGADRGSLHNSGLPGTDVESPFTLDAMRWLAQRFPRDVSLSWDDGSLGGAFDSLLRALAPAAERDGVLNDQISTQQWMAAARGNEMTDVQWLTTWFSQLSCSTALRDHLFESLDVQVTWRLRDRAASRTFQRFPRHTSYCHARGLKRSVDVARVIGKPLESVHRLGRREAEQFIDVARASLAVRQRETDPVTYPNLDEVTLVSLDRGVDVALFGMSPDRRLPLESFFGYLLAKNGLPAAYGGGWVFLDRAEIGINVFDTFRGGESALLFAQVLRVYHQHFGVRRFVVDPFQFGADNEDGIKSGAIWFYYRFGFRLADPGLRAEAEGEWKKVQADRTYRSPVKVLRRLTGAKLVLNVGARGTDACEAPDLVDVGLGVTACIGRRFEGDRAAAERWSKRHVAQALGLKDRSAWPAEECRAFDRLALLVAAIEDLEDWPRAQKSALVKLMRAKGGKREMPYLTNVRRHFRFVDALREIARSGRLASLSQ